MLIVSIVKSLKYILKVGVKERRDFKVDPKE
jgi:hypothetical protein